VIIYMFNFFKKDKKIKEEISQTERIQEEKEELETKLEQVVIEIEQISDKHRKAKLYEEIGNIQVELNQPNEAIQSFEKSLELELSIGNGYKKLMHLYNQKRAEAAREGSDEKIEYYMNKMDNMRQIAKKMTISGQ